MFVAVDSGRVMTAELISLMKPDQFALQKYLFLTGFPLSAGQVMCCDQRWAMLGSGKSVLDAPHL